MRIWQSLYRAFEIALEKEGITGEAAERVWCSMMQEVARDGIEFDPGSMAESSEGGF